MIIPWDDGGGNEGSLGENDSNSQPITNRSIGEFDPAVSKQEEANNVSATTPTTGYFNCKSGMNNGIDFHGIQTSREDEKQSLQFPGYNNQNNLRSTCGNNNDEKTFNSPSNNSKIVNIRQFIYNKGSCDDLNAILQDSEDERSFESGKLLDEELNHHDELCFTPKNNTTKKKPFLIDVFRALHPRQRDAFTVWNTKERARETNYGTRIDYILTTRDLFNSVVNTNGNLNSGGTASRGLFKSEVPKTIETLNNGETTTPDRLNHGVESTTRKLSNTETLDTAQDIFNHRVTTKDLTNEMVSTTENIINLGVESTTQDMSNSLTAIQDLDTTQDMSNSGTATQDIIDADSAGTTQDISYSRVETSQNSSNAGASSTTNGGEFTKDMSNDGVVLGPSRFQKCTVRSDVYGSDHCPVECVLDVEFTRSPSVPSSCAIFMPELSGKQQKIKSYFTTQQCKRPLPTDDAGGGGEIDDGLRSSKKAKKTTVNSNDNKQDIFSYFGSKSNGNSCKNDKKDFSKSTTSNTMDSTAAKTKKSSQQHFELLDLRFKQMEKMAQEKRNQASSSSNNKNHRHNKNTDSTMASKTATWKGLFKGPEAAPLCSGHNEKCILQTVKKEGPNIGRQFYCCRRPSGHSSNKEARCKYFKWKTSK